MVDDREHIAGITAVVAEADPHCAAVAAANCPFRKLHSAVLMVKPPRTSRATMRPWRSMGGWVNLSPNRDACASRCSTKCSPAGHGTDAPGCARPGGQDIRAGSSRSRARHIRSANAKCYNRLRGALSAPDCTMDEFCCFQPMRMAVWIAWPSHMITRLATEITGLPTSPDPKTARCQPMTVSGW